MKRLGFAARMSRGVEGRMRDLGLLQRTTYQMSTKLHMNRGMKYTGREMSTFQRNGLEGHGSYCRKYRRYCQYHSRIRSLSARLQWQYTSFGVIGSKKTGLYAFFSSSATRRVRIHTQTPTPKHNLLSPKQLHSGIHST